MKERLVTYLHQLIKSIAAQKQPGFQFKIIQYRKAITALEDASFDIKNETSLKNALATKFKNPDAIFKKLDDFMKSNKGNIVTDNDVVRTTAIRDLTKVVGIGPAKATEFYNTHGIRSVRGLRSRGDILTKQQKLGVRFYDNMYDEDGKEKRIPRVDIDQYKRLLNSAINVPFEITGSYRRGLPTSGDIDILCKTTQLDPIIKRMTDAGLIHEHISYGKKKWLGFGNVAGQNRRIDILACPEEEYPFSVLYFTGSQSFNVWMRIFAKKKGYKLNEHGLFKNKNRIKSEVQKFDSERDIFKFLEISYVDPKYRESPPTTKVPTAKAPAVLTGTNSIQKKKTSNNEPGGSKNTGIAKERFNVSKGVMLAETFKDANFVPTDWFMSEKYDGIRAIWNGQTLRTRENNEIHAPKWFVDPLPVGIPLDGELVGGSFQETVSIVRKKIPRNDEWKRVIYITFDIPSTNKEFMFEERQSYLTRVIKDVSKKPIKINNAPHRAAMFVIAKQYKIKSRDHMDTFYKSVLASKGEGIMLRKAGSLYEQKRSKKLLKVKPVTDTEAIVTNIIEGKGKHVGKLGALMVKLKSNKNIKFKIGTGFDDKTRESLWKRNTIGKTVTFSYRDTTNSGKPRFPAYMRVRTNA